MDDFFGPLINLGSAGTLTATEAVMHMTLAFVLGQLTAWVYTWTHHGLSYSRSHVQSLVLLSLIVTAVMLAIGNNVARAFGLFGALALIRFRTPIKDTRDTAFLFLSVGIGITIGSGHLLLAIVATAFALTVVLYMSVSRFGSRFSSDGILRFCMPAEGDHEVQMRGVLQHYCRRFALVHLREAGPDPEMEFSYQLRLHDPGQTSGLLQDLRRVPGVTAVSLLMQNEDDEA